MSTVRESWEVIETWLADNHGDPDAVLASPASEAAVETLAETVGVDLPASFREFLQQHDGQRSGSRPLLRRYRLLSTDRITEEWQRMTDLQAEGAFEDRRSDFEEWEDGPDEEVREVWWNDQWVPFGIDASGNPLCLDLDPSPAGTRGQVITVPNDAPARAVQAERFAAWFADVASAVDDGEYVYSEQTHSMMAEPDDHEVRDAKRVEQPTTADLRWVCRGHHDRVTGSDLDEDTDNWFVEVCFELDGEGGPNVQYQWGTLNLGALGEDDRRERATDFCADAGLAIGSESDVFVTATDIPLDAERVTDLIERALADVYDRDPADVAEVRERIL